MSEEEEQAADAWPQCTVLFTSMTSDKLVRVNQERLEQLFYVRGVPTKQIDATEPENKALREALFAISGKRNVYPQVFIESEDGSYRFVGDYAAVHAMNEQNAVTGAFDITFAVVPAYGVKLGEDAGRLEWLAARKAEIEAQAAAWEKCVSKAGEPYWFRRASGESSWVDPSQGVGPDGVWIPQVDAKGRTFFYNRRTGKSAWTLPTQ